MTYELKRPNPIIDARENNLIKVLTNEYDKFISPGYISKGINFVKNKVDTITPERFKVIAKEAIDIASEQEYIKKVIEYSGRGFSELIKHSSRLTLSHERVVNTFKDNGCSIDDFDHICTLRSYKIENIITPKKYADLIAALAEGAVTGFPGLIGLPFNIALSFFLYFRAVQSTALYYGYDIKMDPRELEFASETTITSLAPNSDSRSNTLGGLIGKMMVATNVTSLRKALSTKSYTEMARRGGAELFYVQVRALANKAAEKALKNAGQEGIEAGIFKKMLEQIGRQIPKETGKKSIPLVGAVIGGLSDTYYMSRVLYGSNLIYHKRFLFEKDHRINILFGSNN